MQATHATATEITRDIVVAMVSSGNTALSPNAIQNVVDAFEKIHAVVEKKWRDE